MKGGLRGVIWRLTVFLTVCGLGLFALVAVFAQLRFSPETIYRAEFADVAGLEEGNFVRIAGVEVGKVKSITITDEVTALVSFAVEDSVVLTKGSRAAIRYEDLIGGRFLALEEGTGRVERLVAGDTIALSHTEPALDLDAVIGGFRPLFRALDPDQVNALSGQLIQAFQGQGTTVASLLDQIGVVANTLADRDNLIGEVIANLNVVLQTLDQQSDKFGEAVTSLSGLVQGLEDRKVEIRQGLSNADAAAGAIADLLAQTRPPLKSTVAELDRVAGIAVADHEYLDRLLAGLPSKYRLLARQGLYGDFFSFYLCDLILKVNGKGGQPVFVQLARQPSGRCTPK